MCKRVFAKQLKELGRALPAFQSFPFQLSISTIHPSRETCHWFNEDQGEGLVPHIMHGEASLFLPASDFTVKTA